MYKSVDDRIRKALRHHIHERYKTDVPVVTERPPKLAMGEVASPVCFELAKRLKKPPRALAQEIANSLKPIAGSRARGSRGRRIPECVFRPRRNFFAPPARNRAAKPRAEAADAPEDDGRAHQHQSEQGRAHRPPAQRRARRHVRAAAALRGPPRGSAELHRQHGRAGGRRRSRHSCSSSRNRSRKFARSPPRRNSITSAGTFTRA